MPQPHPSKQSLLFSISGNQNTEQALPYLEGAEYGATTPSSCPAPSAPCFHSNQSIILWSSSDVTARAGKGALPRE